MYRNNDYKRRPFVAWNESPKVAVYGTLRRGGGLHQALQGQKFIGQGKVLGADMYSLGACPGIKLVPDKSHAIIVEVYEVDRDLLTDHLDAIEAMYSRVEVEVNLDDGTTTKAWIYEIDGEWIDGSKKVESGDWNEWRFHHDPFDDMVCHRSGIRLVSRRSVDLGEDEVEVILVDKDGFPVVEGESVCYKDGNPVNERGEPVRLVCIDDLMVTTSGSEHDTVDIPFDLDDDLGFPEAPDLPPKIGDMSDDEFEQMYGNA